MTPFERSEPIEDWDYCTFIMDSRQTQLAVCHGMGCHVYSQENFKEDGQLEGLPPWPEVVQIFKALGTKQHCKMRMLEGKPHLIPVPAEEVLRTIGYID